MTYLIFKMFDRQDCKVEMFTCKSVEEAEAIIRLWQSSGNKIVHRIIAQSELEMLLFGKEAPPNTNGWNE